MTLHALLEPTEDITNLDDYAAHQRNTQPTFVEYLIAGPSVENVHEPVHIEEPPPKKTTKTKIIKHKVSVQEG